MNAEELIVRAKRVLDRCPRPPYELPADDPMRLLFEFVQEGGALAELEDDAVARGKDQADEEWQVTLDRAIRQANDLINLLSEAKAA